MNSTRATQTLIGTAAMLALAGATQGQVLAYEGFDYEAGSEIRTQSGGVGWQDAWEQTSGGFGPGQPFLTAETGLVYVAGGLGIESIGGAAVGVDSQEFLDAREWDATGRYVDGDEFWLSVLVNDGPANDGWRLMFCRDQEGGANGFGLINEGIHTLLQCRIGPDLNGPLLTLPAGPRLLVARFRFSTTENDLFSLWVDPPLDSQPDDASAAHLEVNITINSEHNHVWMRSFGLGGEVSDITLDEIRLGETYESVTPVYVACACDSNDDEYIGIIDLLSLLGDWGSPLGDCNGDGDTNVADLLSLLGDWGDCSGG